MNGVLWVQYIASGLTAGGVYALAALGFSLIYRVSGILNFAQGEFFLYGIFIASGLLALHIPFSVVLVIAVLIVAFMGVLMENVIIKPLAERSLLTKIIMTVGASIFLKGLAQVIWGKESRTLPAFASDASLSLWGGNISLQVVWVLMITVLAAWGLSLFLDRTTTGKILQACAEDRTVAQLYGIDPNKVNSMAFVISAGLGALAGIASSPLVLMNYAGGTMIAVKGFIAGVFGGMDRVWGAVLGGLFLGLAEAFVTGYISSLYKEAITLALLLVCLLFLPQGLLGGRRNG